MPGVSLDLGAPSSRTLHMCTKKTNPQHKHHSSRQETTYAAMLSSHVTLTTPPATSTPVFSSSTLGPPDQSRGTYPPLGLHTGCACLAPPPFTMSLCSLSALALAASSTSALPPNPHTRTPGSLLPPPCPRLGDPAAALCVSSHPLPRPLAGSAGPLRTCWFSLALWSPNVMPSVARMPPPPPGAGGDGPGGAAAVRRRLPCGARMPHAFLPRLPPPSAPP